MILQFSKYLKSTGADSGLFGGGGSKTASEAGRYDKCLNKFGNMRKNRRLMSKDIDVLFLHPLTFLHVKKK
jgi:hypothetical protein